MTELVDLYGLYGWKRRKSLLTGIEGVTQLVDSYG